MCSDPSKPLKVCTHLAVLISADNCRPTGCTNNILNMFDKGSRATFVKSVAKSAVFVVESAKSIADSTTDPAKIGEWVWALKLYNMVYFPIQWLSELVAPRF